MKIRAHLIISGKVQGVSFRRHALEKAKSLELTGWVKNNKNGTVEVTAEGEEEKIKQLIKWCETGPEAAIVDTVDAEIGDFTGEFNKFERLN